MEKQMHEEIVSLVLAKLMSRIGVEASGRHIHLCESDAILLFGTTELPVKRELSQPGQYVYKERVTLIGPKSMIKEVAILGPCRGKTQVELSVTDMLTLGLVPVLRDSGDLHGAGDIVVVSGSNVLVAKEAAIVAKRHLHMSPSDAARLGVKDGQVVAVRVHGSRTVIFEGAVVRVSHHFRLVMHLDYDEANAVGLTSTSYGEIVRLERDSQYQYGRC